MSDKDPPPLRPHRSQWKRACRTHCSSRSPARVAGRVTSSHPSSARRSLPSATPRARCGSTSSASRSTPGSPRASTTSWEPSTRWIRSSCGSTYSAAMRGRGARSPGSTTSRLRRAAKPTRRLACSPTRGTTAAMLERRSAYSSGSTRWRRGDGSPTRSRPGRARYSTRALPPSSPRQPRPRGLRSAPSRPPLRSSV